MLSLLRASLCLIAPHLVVAAAAAGARGGALMDSKAHCAPPGCGSIALKATGVAWRSYPGDRNIAAPTTFSWRDGTPTATASKVQCGLFTNGKAADDGFSAVVQLAAAAREVRAYVGSDASSALLNTSLLDKAGTVLAHEARLVPAAKASEGNGVGNAELVVRWGAATKPAAVQIRWSPVSGGGNLQFMWPGGSRQGGDVGSFVQSVTEAMQYYKCTPNHPYPSPTSCVCGF